MDLKKVYIENTIVTQSHWTYDDVNFCRDQHNKGIFDSSVKLYLAFKNDPRLMSLFSTRTANIFEQDIQVLSDKFEEDNKVIIEALSEADLKEAFVQYLLFGFSIIQIIWDENFKPKLQSFLPARVRYDFDCEKYFILTTETTPEKQKARENYINKQNGFIPISTFETLFPNSTKVIEPGDPKFILLENGHRGFYNGLIKALATPWINIQIAETSWNNFNDVSGSISYKIFSPIDSSNEDLQTFSESLKQMKRSSVVVCPRKEDEYQSYDVTPLETSNSSVFESFKEIIDYCNSQYAITILGQNLSTEVGQSGSYAATETHLSKEKMIASFDKKFLEKNLNEQFIEIYKLIVNTVYDGNIVFPDNKIETLNLQLDAISKILMVAEQLKSFGKDIDIDKLASDVGINWMINS